MTEQIEDEFWAAARAEDAAERGRQADPSACGTCKTSVAAGGQVKHDECAQRAFLLPAPDAPGYELITGMSEEEVQTLPARFHIPAFVEPVRAWVCAVCWGDGWSTQWPCKTATEQGLGVFTAEDYAESRAKREAAELAAYRALDLADLDGRVSASCDNPDHPTWLRAKDDTRGCPWCTIAELEEQRERRRLRLVALQNDALDMRGSLSPNGEDRKVPFPLGETLTPAVDWLIARITELETEVEQHVTANLEAAERAQKEINRLRDELKKYVGHEPTIAEEMAYLSRCLDAVLDLCRTAEEQATRWENPLPVPEWVEQVRIAANGEGDEAAVRPALGWAFTLDQTQRHELLSELSTALLGYWHSDPDTDVLARVEAVLREQRANADGRDVDANQLPDVTALRQALRVRNAQLARLRTEMTGGAR
jgi:hypothetical protein